jgi:serine/threonine-protein kinase
MTNTSTASLVDALRKHRLLESKQLEELGDLQSRFPEAKALAIELIRRGWLTEYQARRLLRGRGHELVLGSYILLERIGEGSMGQVFKARHRNLRRIAAIKLIRKDRLDHPDIIKRFQREVRAAAALDHPNIVLAYDADKIGGTHLLVMEYIDRATDLSQVVIKNGPLPVDQACDFIRQVALGLQHASERGLVHRDIKPHNLLMTPDGKTIKILDMGLARLDALAGEAPGTFITQAGTAVGSADYIAPEQALSSHTADIRADIYSLGCTLYFLLTAQVPFPGGGVADKLLKHLREAPRPIERLRSGIPSEVAALVRKMMAKKPEDRYQTPAEVAAVVSSALGKRSGTSSLGGECGGKRTRE